MTRDAIPLVIPDVSAFAQRLRAALAAEAERPGHLRLLGHLARAAGYKNWQHLRASAAAPTPPQPAPLSEPPLDEARLARALRAFDAQGRLARWPNRTALQGLCLWVLWARLPARRDLTEPEVNAVLKAGHAFGDHALLRRSLIDHGLATRSPDGRAYRRTERRPPPEALVLIARVPAGARPSVAAGR